MLVCERPLWCLLKSNWPLMSHGSNEVRAFINMLISLLLYPQCDSFYLIHHKNFRLSLEFPLKFQSTIIEKL